MVAVMTPAERSAERRKRRQKPKLAKLEPVRPGPVARHPSLTRYPGPTADARPHATARQAPTPPLCVTTSRAGPRPAQGII
jgi:hypothetical protein